jgi:phytoene synthase
MTTTTVDAGYREGRHLNARYGRTYYLATLLLPAHKRPGVHALYGFARHVDDIVDGDLAPDVSARRLDEIEASFRAGADSSPLLAAVHDTIDRWRIPLDVFDPFFTSMRMDLTVSSYASWSDLETYIYGSAAVIGLQMLPILEPLPGMRDAAAGPAADLGRAFQLTNFIRDVGEDLGRNRLYLPAEDLDRFDVSRRHLEAGVVDAGVRDLIAFEVERARALFRAAEPGIAMLHPTSRDCIRTALVLYRGILDEIERGGYRVLDRRATVGVGTRLRVAAPALVRAWWTRRPHHTHHANVCNTSENPNSRSSTGA